MGGISEEGGEEGGGKDGGEGAANISVEHVELRAPTVEEVRHSVC
jgi:hypothetical protein